MKNFSPNVRKILCFLFLLLVCGSINSSNGFAADLTGEAVRDKESTAKLMSETWSGEAYRRSIILYSEAAEDWTKLGELKKASFCWREAAKLSQLVSDYDLAFKALNKSLEIDGKNDYSEGKVISLSLLSLISRQKGDVKKSENYYKQALDLSKTSPTDAARAYALFSAGMFNFYYGDMKKTIEYFLQANSFAEKTDDVSLITQTLLFIGFSYGREGQPLSGLQKMQEALRKCQEAKYLRGQTLAHFGIGFLSMLMDEKQQALDAYKRAEELFPQDFEWLERAKLYNSIAAIYEEYGVLSLGEIYRQRALEFYQKANYPYGQLATLPSLAKLKYLKGEKALGKNLYDEALTLAEKLNDEFYLAIIKEDLGDLKLKDNLFDEAISNYQAAFQVYKKLKIKYPKVENSLGKAFEKKGDFVTARNYYNTALETNRNIRDMLSGAENLYNLAGLNLTEGNLTESLLQIEESLKITETLYNNVTNSKLQTNYLSNVFDRYELYINLLMKMDQQSPQKNYAIEALQAAEKSRGRFMLEKLSLSEADFTKDADAETVKREKEIRVLLNAKADKLTSLLSRKAEKSETDKISGELHELENELADIKAKLKQNSPVYSAIKNPEPFNIEEFQNEVLDEDSLLLEFSLGTSESYLWLVGKNEVSSYILPARAEIESKVEILRELIGARIRKKDETLEDHQARITKADNEFPEAARQLSRMLFGQIAGKLAHKRLIIVPDGKLHYLPVSALPFPNSGTDEPILLSNEVIYEPSASTLALIAKNQRQIQETSKKLLVFSDPVFTEEDSRFSVKTETAVNIKENAGDNLRFAENLDSLPRLSESKDEGDSIVKIAGASNSDIFTGFAATREQFLKANVSDYKILHFATHGLIDETRPELSGIIFSRFSEKRENLDEFVRLQDIYGLNLNADLVVLSACETGVGKEVKGEGLLSLNNAFLQVGAKTVLSSLWKVEDAATVELMKNFYQIIAEEKTTSSKALQKAQKKLWESGRYKSPFYWAAFTMQGDFRRVPEISSSRGWSYTPLFLILIPVIFSVGIFAFFKRRKGKKIISR